MIADAMIPTPTTLPAVSSWRGRKAAPPSGSAAATRTPPSVFPLFGEIEGEFLAAALVDQDFEVVLTPEREDAPEMEAEALANAELVEAAQEAAEWLGLDDEVLEIQVTLKDRVEFIRPLDPQGAMFLYAALDKEKGKYFDLARMRLRMIELAFGL